MAVKATGSTFTRNNRLYLAVMCLGLAAWFAYDGWISQAYQQKETDEQGNLSANLMVNRYAPIPLTIVAIGSLISGIAITSKFVQAEQNGLKFSSGLVIPYQAMTQIDKRSLQEKGYFIIKYQQDQSTRSIKLSDRTYDHLADLLDEIIKQTGAQPAADMRQDQQST